MSDIHVLSPSRAFSQKSHPILRSILQVCKFRIQSSKNPLDEWARTMVAFTHLVLALCVAVPTHVSAARKNVLFFAVDDLRMQLDADRVPGV
jgi:hypothetical protein